MATPRRPRNLPAPRPNPLRELVTQKNRAADAVRERRRVQELKSELPSIIQERVGEQIQKLENRLLSEVKEIGQRAIEESTAAISDQLTGRIETLEKVSAMQTETLASLRDSSQSAERKVSQVVNQIEQSLASVVPGFELAPSKLPPLPEFPSLRRTNEEVQGYVGAPEPTQIQNYARGVLAPIEDEVEDVVQGYTVSPVRLRTMPRPPVGDRLNFYAVAPDGTHPQFQEAPMEMVKAEPADITEIVGKNGFCPNCTSVDVRRANRKGMFEEFLRLFFIAPFRCRACRHKFYRF